MPTRQLTTADTATSSCEWLNQNVQGPIVPIPANLDKVPKEKGLYVWTFNPRCYEKLSKYVKITPIDPVCKINGWDVVYIGSAGLAKKGGGNLYERIKWHISDKHTCRSVCSGALSTLRAGLGALLSDDLINPSTEADVNEVLESCFRLYWIHYERAQQVNIKNDENIIINRLKPLFNIVHNPNARPSAGTTATNIYRKRRNEVYMNTRKRCDCGGNGTSAKQIETPPSKPDSAFSHQVFENDKCVWYSFLQKQNIHQVTKGIPYLPIPSKFMICDPKSGQQIYAPKRGGWRTTGVRGNQDIYTYFNNVDGNMSRWQIIQAEMIEKKIQEAIVVVCPADLQNLPVTPCSAVARKHP